VAFFTSAPASGASFYRYFNLRLLEGLHVLFPWPGQDEVDDGVPGRARGEVVPALPAPPAAGLGTTSLASSETSAPSKSRASQR
jgi:hypothetical protein